jgi:ABC-type glycerol-3-phosphate transport system substrate-binding protein
MLKALAEDRGPDIFSIPHSWIGLYGNIIAPEPESVSIQRVVIKPPGPGDLKPTIEKIYTEQVPLLRPRDIKRNYYPFVKDDVLREAQVSESGDVTKVGPKEQIMALPLYVDTLALYYNKDILEENNIFDPPQTWERFQQDVIKIAKVDKKNNILQPAAAIGTTANLVRPTDILAALMLQTGVRMIDEQGDFAAFHQALRQEDNYNAGLEALRFFTDFSDTTKKVYTWNNAQDQALEVFRQGKLAYFFGFSYNLDAIRGSKVNFGVAPLPIPRQAVSNISIANYWVETVSKKSANQDQAWHFLNWLSMPDNLLKLQSATNKISPLKEHLDKITNPELAVFASQAPSAQVWYHGKDAPRAEDALMEMINSVVSGTRSLEDALSFGVQQVTETLR